MDKNKNKKNNNVLELSYRIWGRKDQLIFATFLQSLSWFLSLSLYSYLSQMSVFLALGDVSFPVWLEMNFMGKVGGYIAHYLLKELCGISALMVPLLPFIFSWKLFFPSNRYSLIKSILSFIFLMSWVVLAISYWHYVKDHKIALWYNLPSRLSMKVAHYLGDLLGGGVVLLLIASLASFIITLMFNILSVLKSPFRAMGNQKNIKKSSEEVIKKEKVVPFERKREEVTSTTEDIEDFLKKEVVIKLGGQQGDKPEKNKEIIV